MLCTSVCGIETRAHSNKSVKLVWMTLENKLRLLVRGKAKMLWLTLVPRRGDTQTNEKSKNIPSTQCV